MTLTCVNLTGVNFRNLQLRVLGGRKIDDCTGLGLDGWTIIVYNATTNTTYTTTTSTIGGTVGIWAVPNLPPGDYQVREVLNEGRMNVTPISLNVTLPRCADKRDVNFHNRPLKCVSGYKLDACNGTGIAGWKITLNNSSYTDTKTTDLRRQIRVLRPGSRQVHLDRDSEARLDQGQLLRRRWTLTAITPPTRTSPTRSFCASAATRRTTATALCPAGT